MENVGGRLLLRYDTPGPSCKDFWVFCTSECLHSYGFTNKSNSTWFLEPPSSIVDLHSYEEWKDLVESKPKDYELMETLFDNDVDHPKHSFKVGMKVEALNPTDQTKIYPATVTKVFDDVYFLVSVDVHTEVSDKSDGVYTSSNSENNTWLCTAEHPYIFPVGWSCKHNIT